MLLKQRLVLFSRFSRDAVLLHLVSPNRQSFLQRCASAILAIAFMCVVTGCAAGKKPAAKRPIIVDRSIHTDDAPVAERADDVAETINPSQSASPVNLVSMESFLQADDDTIAPKADSLKPPPNAGKPETVWTLQELKSLALQNNPAVKQAAAAASKADGVHNQTGLRPNPTVGYFAEEIGDAGRAGLHGAFVSQTFVRGDKLAWNEQVVGHEVQMRRWNEKSQRQRVLTDVEIHYATALAAQQRLQLTQDFRKVAEQGVKVSEQRVEARFAGRADILQSEIQLSQIDLAIQQTELQIDAAWKQLTAVAGLPQLARRPLQNSTELLTNRNKSDDALSELLSSSPLLAAARHRVSRAKANLQRQQVQKTPNVTAQLGTGHDYATGDAFANVQLSVPLPAHNQNHGNIHAAWSEYCEAKQNIRRLEMQIRRDMAAEMRDYESAMAAVEQYRDVIIPKAKETLDLMKQAQAGGEYDFLRVLTARRSFYDASINCVDACQALTVADAKINGQLLTGGLNGTIETPLSTGLRGQALSQQ